MFLVVVLISQDNNSVRGGPFIQPIWRTSFKVQPSWLLLTYLELQPGMMIMRSLEHHPGYPGSKKNQFFDTFISG